MDYLGTSDDKTKFNDSYTANNVWKTIQRIVTEELIKGKQIFTKDLLPKEDIKTTVLYW